MIKRMKGECNRERKGRKETNNMRAAVAQRGCQVQSGVGRQDSQGAVTGGESWETCVSCLPRLQTTSLCFTGPFFPSTHRQPPSIHSPPPRKKNTTGLPPCVKRGEATNRDGHGGRSRDKRSRDEKEGEGVTERGFIVRQTDEDGDRVTKGIERLEIERRGKKII